MIEHILESKFLENLYPEGFNFEGLMSDLSLSWDGPSIEIALHSTNIPNVFPKKWSEHSNRIRLELRFFEIDEVNLTKWGRYNEVSISHQYDGELHSISIKGNDCFISFKCKWIRFISISPYYSREF